MNREELLAHYKWKLGSCFLHPDKGAIATTVVKVIRPRTKEDREVRACQDCVVAIEAKRRRAAEDAGVEYEPGRAGAPLG